MTLDLMTSSNRAAEDVKVENKKRPIERDRSVKSTTSSDKENVEKDDDGEEKDHPPQKRSKTLKPEQSAKDILLQKQKKEAEILEKKQQKEQEKMRKEEERETEKRRKEAEKEAERLKREELKIQKEAEKEEERKRKESEKEEERKRKEKQKEEERLKRESAKEELRKEKEEEKKRKEEKKEEEKNKKEQEKKKREDEKKKKEEQKKRSQLNLGTFFSIRKPKERSENSPATETDAPEIGEPATTEAPLTYNEYFLPFHIRTSVTIAPANQLAKADDHGDMLSWITSHRQQRGGPPNTTIREIVRLMNESSASEEDLGKLLHKVPHKLLQFEEDVRPPYFGSFSKYAPDVALRPFDKIIPSGINYDYDSETEWVQDEDDDGEDIGDEDSDDGVDDEDEDMDEFLDADGEEAGKRRNIIGPLEAMFRKNDGSEPELFSIMEIESFLPVNGPIDPYKNYWESGDDAKAKAKADDRHLNPFTLSSGAVKKPGKILKIVPEESFKDVLTKVEGSDMSLILLVEIVKRELPKLSKESIRNTIKSSATQQGQKDQKRWTVNKEYQKYLA